MIEALRMKGLPKSSTYRAIGYDQECGQSQSLWNTYQNNRDETEEA
jgi:hypothetical protein